MIWGHQGKTSKGHGHGGLREIWAPILNMLEIEPAIVFHGAQYFTTIAKFVESEWCPYNFACDGHILTLCHSWNHSHMDYSLGTLYN